MAKLSAFADEAADDLNAQVEFRYEEKMPSETESTKSGK